MLDKAMVLLSGGQDSTTCLFWAKDKFRNVHVIRFNYGQKHSRELQASWIVADLAKIPAENRDFVVVRNVLQGTSPLINEKEQVEQYKDYNSLPGGLEKTFVPGRNALFLLIAANHAYVKGIHDLVIGVSQEDYGGYPDCRAEFVSSMESSLSLAFDFEFRIHTPLIHLSKAGTVILAKILGEDAWNALAYTHTCYNGQYPPCGKCHACLLRQKGFDEAGYEDPLIARAKKEGLIK